MTRVKICGITNLDDALAACEAGADAIGFIFAAEARKRNRYIAPDEARKIAQRTPPFVSTVAVCVDETPARLVEYLEFVDWVQLSGDESVADCADVAHRAIKAFRTAPDFRPESMLRYPTAGYHLDAYVAGQHGGTGKTCDWALAQKAAALGRPLILAGGLTPENVAAAVRIVRPYAVDTAGGVERSPGKKDHERIRSFVQQAKYALSG
ncbi:MAG TPA: phosphoribosylanthranilate isomerase [Candidatus Hydrogenedentes bacterium]|nr:phosphoribosylanthranilate isomerase [Candidatus Hydrogenedentota bacterium]HIJ72510.1 phosphoribosylanthranilate isomerase [Candidatus Hydrogenedentota bacterium]